MGTPLCVSGLESVSRAYRGDGELEKCYSTDVMLWGHITKYIMACRDKPETISKFTEMLRSDRMVWEKGSIKVRLDNPEDEFDALLFTSCLMVTPFHNSAGMTYDKIGVELDAFETPMTMAEARVLYDALIMNVSLSSYSEGLLVPVLNKIVELVVTKEKIDIPFVVIIAIARRWLMSKLAKEKS